MVEKENKKQSRRSAVDKHNDGTGDRFVQLESKLVEFIDKLNCVSTELENIKQQQHDLIELVKQTLIEKK
jgi:hypothetical protein